MRRHKKELSELQEKIKNFEKQGLFTAPGVLKEDFFAEDKVYKVDKNFKYIDNSLGFKFSAWIAFEIQKLFSLFVGCYYGMRIRGKENLKKIKKSGAITVSNHFMYLDNVLVDRIFFGKSRVYYIVAEKNNIKGILGYFMRRGGIIPIGSTIRAKINFMKAVNVRLQEKRIVHVFAEEEMWLHYKKPRPLNIGAFRLACENNVPILPIFFAYKENGKFRNFFNMKNKIVAYIMNPAYINKEMKQEEAIEELRYDVEKQMRDCYEHHYKKEGLPLYDITEEGKEIIKNHKALLD